MIRKQDQQELIKLKIPLCFVFSLKIISRHFKVKKDSCERGLLGLSSLQFSALYLKPLIQTQGILRGTIDKRLHRSQAPQAAIFNYPNCTWKTCTALQVNLGSEREAGVKKKKNHNNKQRVQKNLPMEPPCLAQDPVSVQVKHFGPL